MANKDSSFNQAVKDVAPWEFGEIIIAEQHPPGSAKPIFSWISLDTYNRIERELGESGFNIRHPHSQKDRLNSYGISFDKDDMPTDVFIAFRCAASKFNTISRCKNST